MIPAVITVVCLVLTFRPYQPRDLYDFGAVLKGLWLVPAGVAWIVYFGWVFVR